MFLSRQHQQWCCLFFVPWCEDVDMGCGSHFGGKAWQVEFRVGVRLVGALCGAWVCAGKRVWLVWTGLHGTPPRFSSCLTRHSFPSVIFAAFPLVFGALRASSAPALQSILAVWLFNTLTLSVLLGYPAFRSKQAKPFKYMSSSALCFTLVSVIRHSPDE